ncbi:MAG: DUF222 domain-containing protein, partial [Actinomycetota bacterium]|nr:DUF222 domain-containing protein [Actinomycetota bacterium]
HDQAGYYRSIGEVATAVPTGEDGPPERSQEWYEYANMEVRAALTLTRRAADNEISNAHDLLERYPMVWEALESGSIDMRKALTILRGISHLDVGDAQSVVDVIVGEAALMTTGQIRAKIRRLSIELDPDEAKERTRTAIEERRMIIEPTVDTTADLHAYGAPIDRAAAIGRRINAYARSLKNADETRTMDQLRMDVFLDILEGNHDTGQTPRGMVGIHVDLRTLAEMSESPGELAGYGPVHADIARQVAANQPEAEWRYTVTDDNGQVVHTGITRRRPTAAQQREITARYQTCTFPGCRIDAQDCDIDHITPYSEGGPTTVANNAPVCEPDHYGRHIAGWTYRRLPDGRHEWTSRLGHTYITWEDHPP